MDPQMLFNLASGAVVGGIGWFARQIWDSVQRLQAELHSLEVELPKTYVSKFDLDKRMDHIEGMFQRIYDKLDGKADK